MSDRGTTWIDETRKAVDQASNVVRAQSESEALADVDEGLDNSLRDLAQLRQAAALGQGVWWAGVDAPADFWTELRSARTNLARRQLASVVRQLPLTRTRIRDAVQKAWKNYVVSQAGDASELRDLMQALSGSEGLADVARSLNEALGRLTRLQKNLPNTEAVDALQEAVKLLDALERRLPVAVKAFVSAAARRGASLELLDNEVWGWLVDHGALHNFRVVQGKPQDVTRG